MARYERPRGERMLARITFRDMPTAALMIHALMFSRGYARGYATSSATQRIRRMICAAARTRRSIAFSRTPTPLLPGLC